MAVKRKYNRILALFFLFVVVWALGLWMTLMVVTQMQKQEILRENRAAAEWGARLLDSECQATLNSLRQFAQDQALAESLGGKNHARLNEALRQIRDLSPAPVFAAVYQTNGRMVAGYPRTPDASLSNEDLRLPSTAFSAVSSEFARVKEREHSDLLVFYLPLPNAGNAAGVLQVGYRVETLAQRLSDRRDLSRLYFVTRKGRVVPLVECAGCSPREITLDSDFVKSLAQQKGAGNQTLPANKGQEPLLTGYAASPLLNGMIVDLLPARAASVSGWPLLQILVLSLPMLLLMILGTRALLHLNARQDRILKQMAEQNEQLRAADSAKSDFLANISHDLWTPLAGIQVAITGLLDPNANWKPGQVRDCLQAASRQVDRLSDRVRNLLEMARLEANADQSQKEPCDLADIVASGLERLQPLLAGRRVEAFFPPVPLMFDARYAQFEIVVLNLLENAIKYTPPGSPLVIRGEYRGSDIYFSLQDQGPGVARSDVHRIFEKFYRAQQEHPMGGAGLGLAICKKIVESHGGVIGVTNIPTGGAEFWFSVPAMTPFKEHRR